MRFSFHKQLSLFRQSFRFHYLWRGFFFGRIYAGIEKLGEKANRFSCRLLIAYTIALGLLVAVNGLARVVLHHLVQWTGELSLWLLVGICFVGSGIAIGKGLHVGITIIIELAPSCMKRTLIFAGNSFITVFLLCLTGVSFLSVLDAAQKTGKYLKIPLAVPYMQIPLGCILILAQMLPFLAGPLLKDADPEKYLLTRILPGE
jgi:TRAP-type C4-dicarboxylate transport system permease small subunit